MLQMLRVLKMTLKTCSCSRPWQCLWRGMLVSCNLETAVTLISAFVSHHHVSQCASTCAVSILVCVAGSKQKNSRTTTKTGKQKHGKLEEAADDTKNQAPDTMPAKAKTQKKAPKPRKAKATSRVGLVNPTEEEMKKAFSMFNSSNRSVISTEDISRVSDSTHFLLICLVNLADGDLMSPGEQSVVTHSA